MAAGDIILSSGATITASEIQQIAAEVKKELAAESKELSQFEEVTSLANVSSLPGIQQSGATLKLVRVALEVLKGVDGKNIELTASQTAIQWRNVGDSTWNTLVDLSLLKGSKGDKGDKGDTGEKGETGATGATGAKGDPGEKVMLRKGATGIEWKYEDDASWQTLVPMADLSFTFDELTDEQKQEISRKPILGTVEATKGDTPSGSFTADGTDEHGNPKYRLNLVLPKGDKGDKGEPPVIEQGTVTTANPGTSASVEVVPNGETEEGNPRYILNFTIPKGDPGKDGEGAGNVYVAETGLVSGKQYLFQPGANNSPNGVFVEYTPPTIPEQVQPDWNATEGKGAILNKPTILPEAPKDGKQYARKNGAWTTVESGIDVSDIPVASSTKNGLMSSSDYTKLKNTKKVYSGYDLMFSLAGKKSDYIRGCLKGAMEYTGPDNIFDVKFLDECYKFTLGDESLFSSKFYQGNSECFSRATYDVDNSVNGICEWILTKIESGKLKSVTIRCNVKTENEVSTYTYSASTYESENDMYWLNAAIANLSPSSTNEEIVEAFDGSDGINNIRDFINRSTAYKSMFCISLSMIRSAPVSVHTLLGLNFSFSFIIADKNIARNIYLGPEGKDCYVKDVYLEGYKLKPEVYLLNPNSTSDEISTAVGGEAGFKKIIQAVKDGNRLVIRGTIADLGDLQANQDLICNLYGVDDNGDMYIIFFGMGVSLFGGSQQLEITYTKSSNTFRANSGS